MHQKAKRLVERFSPAFDESTLFIMGISFMSLFFIDAQLRTQIVGLVSIGDSHLSIVIALYFIGTLLSIVHVFTSRVKTELEKQALLTFAIATNAIAGFFAGSIAFASATGILTVFSGLCVLNACLLVVFCMHGIIDLSNIRDDNSKDLIEPLVGAGVCVLIVGFTALFSRLHWSEVYSICIVYASNINTPLNSFVRNLINQS